VQIGSIICTLVAALALAGMALTMFFDVIGRYGLNRPIPGAGELIEILLAVTVFAALPLATASREHIQLDYLEMAFRQGRRRYVRAVNWSVSAIIMGFIAWRVAMTTGTIIRYGDTTSYLHIPIAPFGVLITVMISASTLVLVYLAWAEIAKPSEPASTGTQL
jgi:TRAP-type C4-dicarboxylate transport system permease small subunit